MHRALPRIFLEVCAAALAVCMLLIGALFWRLDAGPIGLPFLTPYLEAALNPEESATTVSVSDTVLTWVDGRRTIDIRALGIDIVDGDGGSRAQVPALSISLSVGALFRGLVAPSRIDVIGARLRARRTDDGRFDWGFELDDPARPTDDAGARRLLANLLGPPDSSSSSGYLTELNIRGASLSVEDVRTGGEWHTRDTDILFRRDRFGVRAATVLDVVSDGLRGRFSVSGTYSPNSDRLHLRLAFPSVSPDLLARVEPILAEVARIDAPLSGHIEVSLDGQGTFVAGSFNLVGDSGTAAVPEYYDAPIAFRQFKLSGRIEDGANRIIIENASADLGETELDAKAVAQRDAQDAWRIEFDGRAMNLPIENAADYWPRGVKPRTQGWVERNLEDVIVDQATIRLDAVVDGDDLSVIEVTDIGGTIDFHDGTVHYLRPMSPLRAVRGRAEYDSAHFIIRADAGELGELQLSEAVVDLVDLDRRRQFADITLTVTGPIPAALRLIDEQPLGYSTALQLDPQTTGGSQRTELRLRMPLIGDLTLGDVQVEASSKLSGFSMDNALAGNAIKAGNLSLDVDRTRLAAEGSLRLGDTPVTGQWQRNFAPEAEFRSQFRVSGQLDGAARDALALPFGSLVGGPVGVGITYTTYDHGIGTGAVQLDLTSTAINVPALDWTKAAGSAIDGYAEFIVERGHVTRVPIFDLRGDDLIATGNVRFDDETAWSVKRISLQRLLLAENDMFGSISFREGGGFDALIGGARLDLRPFLNGEDGEDGDGSGASIPFSVITSPQSPIGQVVVRDDVVLANVRGSVVHDGTGWRELDVEAVAGEAGNLTARMTDAEGVRAVRVTSDNAGELMRGLGWYPHIEGGTLEVMGTMEFWDSEDLFVGDIQVRDFVVREAPALAKLLTLSSLTGIVNTLSGSGIAFSSLDIPLALSPTRIQFDDALARGSDLAITARGVFDRQAGTLELNGELAPAYMLNSLVGKIPVLGKMILGGQDGLFVATYKTSGPLDALDISVNPLTILTPGIARGIIGTLGKPSPFDGETPGGGPRDE